MLQGEKEWNDLTGVILGCCLEVQKEVGPGLLESVYEDCLAREFSDRGLDFQRQKAVPVIYKGSLVGDPFRLDFLVEGKVIVEVKAIERVIPIHEAQVLTYLKLTGCPIALIVNFHSPLLKEGVRRFMNS